MASSDQSTAKVPRITVGRGRREAALAELARLDAPEVLDLPPSAPRQTTPAAAIAADRRWNAPVQGG
jgi:hypothetical protein